jgi:hypothetical protein
VRPIAPNRLIFIVTAIFEENFGRFCRVGDVSIRQSRSAILILLQIPHYEYYYWWCHSKEHYGERSTFSDENLKSHPWGPWGASLMEQNSFADGDQMLYPGQAPLHPVIICSFQSTHHPLVFLPWEQES